MKKVLFAALLMITSIAAFSQEQHNPKFRHEARPEMRGNFQHNPQFGTEHFPMHPKPEKIIVKGDKVIVIFNRVDFEKLSPMVRERVMWKERQRTKTQQILIDKFTK
jgi:hypothetical protein